MNHDDTPETTGQLAAIAHEPRDVAVRKLGSALRGMERRLNKAASQRDKLAEALRGLSQPCGRADYTVGQLDQVVCGLARGALNELEGGKP